MSAVSGRIGSIRSFHGPTGGECGAPGRGPEIRPGPERRRIGGRAGGGNGAGAGPCRGREQGSSGAEPGAGTEVERGLGRGVTGASPVPPRGRVWAARRAAGNVGGCVSCPPGTGHVSRNSPVRVPCGPVPEL
ncbi:hypothetical protein CP972_12160 [Streptomyces prasinus]|uniref:Uncharacterized protein n=1 Tax=Streptomyces prasinus TaxID=67345 RepID=A0ABX6AXA4_9ACTN|nr:hypothetical protein CP972_12160 [Streptomyces prasinus]